ncbi:small nuclear ribonucleoprotein Sm D3 [Apiotrichum porosum]|uniref:Small nuclear ribonucleoprotein Sm D3 n=1 Tax=Apiotrichum porosum TaxID=105984 RepID=A0A427XSE9_9TREE|nr:small nuclear ribonucleoprotein Sm D3 [Apiotrichum porosum]RSH81779.1 small nuclear ribonucleoprotein Sm D3 [Apiotrichum porosum]
MANLGVPIKLLHESLGHIITVELKTGETYRGKLMEDPPLFSHPPPFAANLIVTSTCPRLFTVTVPPCLSRGAHQPNCPTARLARALRSAHYPFHTRPPTAEDSLNMALREITVTARDGRVSQLEQVYIRGSMVRFIIVPDLLANAPMFKRVGPNAMRGRGIGAARGRATIQRANARRGAPRGQGVRR